MSLSERERRALVDIELQLSHQAPRLATRLSTFGHTRKRRLRHSRIVRWVGVAAGVGLYAAGVHLGGGYGTAVAVLGYCVAAAAIATGLPRL